MSNAIAIGGDEFGYSSNYSNSTVLYGPPTNDASPTKSWLVELLAQIYLVALPLICISGVVGNALAFFIFASKPMRRTSCSWYLATRSVADGGFLLATFITWSSDASRERFFHTDGLCQITIFSTFVFAFLSVWMTVVVTSENFIRICRPFSVSTFCNVRISQIVIVFLVVLGVALYNFPLWTNVVVHIEAAGNASLNGGHSSFYWCGTKPQYASLVKWMSFWDLLITLLIPSLAIVVLMIFITASLVRSLKRQTRLQGKGQRSTGSSGCGNNEVNQTRSSRNSNSPQAKVTRMLFAVSLLFILLNSPSHIIRTKMAVVELLDGPARSNGPTAEHKIQVVFQIIYYLSFGVNLLVYLACGDNFRKIFKETYLKPFLRPQARGTNNEMTALTTVRLEDNEPIRYDPPAVQQQQQNVPNNNQPADQKQLSPTKTPTTEAEQKQVEPNFDKNGAGDDDKDDDNDDDDHRVIQIQIPPEVNGNSQIRVNHKEEKEEEEDNDKNLINLQTTDL